MNKVSLDEQLPEIVFPMWQAAYNAVDMARELSSPLTTKITTGLPSVDKYLNPLISGNLISVIGRPGHAKTFFTDYMLIKTINDIVLSGRANDEAVILIATEVSVEVAALKWMAQYSKVLVSTVMRGECSEQDLQRIDDSSYKIMNYPIFFIGYSEQRGKNSRRSRPNLNPETLNDALDYIINTYKNGETGKFLDIKLVVTDYLQQLHRPVSINEVSYFSSCVSWAKDVAVWSRAPHILNVQAGRQVDERGLKGYHQIPLVGDSQWTSNVEQTSTTVLSVHRPDQAKLKTMPSIWDQTPEISKVTPDMFYLALLKQKEAISNKVWLLKMGFDNFGLTEYNFTNNNQH